MQKIKEASTLPQAEFTSKSREETIAFGKHFSMELYPGDVVAFYGDLGSGKTTLIRGICTGLEVDEMVTSPTFTLINEYHGKFPVYHFDFYRLASEMDLHDLGVEEYFNGDGICLIEWPEVVHDLLPENKIGIHLKARFEPGWENKREIIIFNKRKDNKVRNDHFGNRNCDPNLQHSANRK
ncbi:MAG: tRNA (adenosine(37)-N6)-threonylcarbamoyltransferase complex ATPase subunit type 1 TsaE [Actinobacteria bacterium]|nr:tRNA (adenosine(37)-N6)-threonylcarbamoyltransferase complex ATPase subunit type 1 TsaE [Actinomycetota bacterium]